MFCLRETDNTIGTKLKDGDERTFLKKRLHFISKYKKAKHFTNNSFEMKYILGSVNFFLILE